MADFMITAPDGRKYKVSGDNAEGAYAALRKAIDGGEQIRPQRREPTQSDLDRAANADAIAMGQMQDAFDKKAIENVGGVAAGLTTKFSQGVPFIGEWVDELADKIKPGAGERMSNVQSAMDRQYPKTSLATEIAGGVTGSIPLALTGAGPVMKGASTASKVVRGVSLGAAAGASEGAVAGAGRANSGDRGAGAVEGAVVGGVMGGAFGGLAPVLGQGVEATVKKIKRLDVSTIAEEFGLSAPAARRIKASLMNDDLDAALTRLQGIGDDAMLADAGPATAQTLDDAMSGGGAALRVARGRIDDRLSQSSAALSQKLDDILGSSQGLRSAQSRIAQRTSAARNAAYERAWSSPIDYSTGGSGEGVLTALQRVPSRYLRPAIQRANDRAQMAGQEGFKQIMATVDDAGGVSFSELPNVRQLHEIKVALDDIVRAGTDDLTGKLSPDAMDAQKVAGALRDAIKDASPAYASATKLGGDKIAEENALRLGRRLLSPSTTVEEVRDISRGWKAADGDLSLPVPMNLAGATTSARDAARQGLREQIEETLSNVRRTITDPNVDAREAMQLVKDMSSRANQTKVRMILGSQANALFDELDKAEAALALRAAVSRNSATAIRTAGREAMQSELQPSLLRRTLGNAGNPLDAAKEVTRNLAGIDARSMNAAEQKLMGEIADALTRLRGADAQSALSAVNRAMQGQPMKDAEAALVGRLIAGSGYSLGYQGAEQYRNSTP